MTIELLKQNIEREKQIIAEIIGLYEKIEDIDKNSRIMPVNPAERKITENSILSLASQLRMINEAVPNLIENISFYKPISESKKSKEELVNIKYTDKEKGKIINLVVKKKDHLNFLESLSKYTPFFKNKTKKKSNEEESEDKTLEQFGPFIKFSNKLFRETANKIIQKGYFDSVKENLTKISSQMILGSYVSIMLAITCIIGIFGFALAIVLFLLDVVSILTALMIIFFLPLLTFILMFFYPSSERKSLEKQINQELPFMIIYMSAIATSGIEPSKIFQIIATSSDYPSNRREIRKLTNSINFYGYDLVTALKNAAKTCPSERLAQLFEGLSTTITSGGELAEFLNKHSETLLFDYRLEREKYTRIAETFMNIYISVVIAAPMIMMMLFILMSLTSIGSGLFSPAAIGLLTVLIISMLNIGFIVFLNMKQPKF